MRRVEQNGRPSPGCPWSIRHTGVYQRLVCSVADLREPSSTILLVAPSSAIEGSVLEMATDSSNNLKNTFSVHKSIVAGSLTGWMEYMCWLEDQLKLKSSRVMATLGSTESRALSFMENDRHDLRQLEEYITDLRVLLHTKVQTIRRLTASFRSLCSLSCPESRNCECRQTIQELEGYADEAQMYQERAGVLQDRVQSVQNLLSDLLGYEELRTLRELMLHGVKGSMAMEQLAIIGLVFIPTTLVENFFSTEFVKFDGETLQVSRQAWFMAAVAAPMTVCVVVFWRLWLRFESLGLQPFSLARQSLKAFVKTRRLEKKGPEDGV
ncbi:hypothetical protein BDW66DRAFT_129522 [Aspergillus desertorum]